MALGCRHLIKKSIVLLNYRCISEKLADIEDPEELKKQIELLKNNSIMTWEHVNMQGRYNFKLDIYQLSFDMFRINCLFINNLTLLCNFLA